MTRRKRGTPEPFDDAALDALLGGRKTLEEVDQLFTAMKKSLMERVLKGELTAHLGYPEGAAKPEAQANQRNGSSPKTVHTPEGSVTVDIPRDRAGTFTPQLIPKHVRRLPRFDHNVL